MRLTCFLGILCAVRAHLGVQMQDTTARQNERAATHVILLNNVFHDDNTARNPYTAHWHGVPSKDSDTPVYALMPHMASQHAYALLQQVLHSIAASATARRRRGNLRGTSLIQTADVETSETEQFPLWPAFGYADATEAREDEKINYIERVHNFRNHEYLGEIEVGTSEEGQSPQKINVVFDTGSTNTWINSVRCKDKACRSCRQFDPERSLTFRRLEGRTTIYFGTAYIEGIKGMDTIRMGPITVKDQQFGLIVKEHGHVFDAIPIEGILGLSFPALSSFGPEGIIDHIFRTERLKRDQFAFYLSPRGQGKSAVMFGEVSDVFYEKPLKCFPVLKDETMRKFWLVAVESLHLVYPNDTSKEPVLFRGPSFAIFDTGTNLFSVDPAYFNSLWSFFRSCKLGNYQETFPSMPTLRFKMKTTEGELVDVDVPANEYMLLGSNFSAESEVLPGWMSVKCEPPDGPAYIFGQLFMHYWFTLFDRSPDKPQVCIARSVHTTDTDEMLQGGVEQQTHMPIQAAKDSANSDLREFGLAYPFPEVSGTEDQVPEVALQMDIESALEHETLLQSPPRRAPKKG